MVLEMNDSDCYNMWYCNGRSTSKDDKFCPECPQKDREVYGKCLVLFDWQLNCKCSDSNIVQYKINMFSLVTCASFPSVECE